ncbi:hypothetical protein [Candidatus Laterigemmans baculatus]|uniref:hypothetical protein n=1 Tax=Candidatus Laterigemmans baculatus TaxID=2770505 RepID=UPI0013DAFD93|nr:hypothetical protein [Candidatus Laterigemmans baculatus]
MSITDAMATTDLRMHLRRVTRDGQRVIQQSDLDTGQLNDLASSHLGMFSGGFTSCEPMIRKLAALSQLNDAQRWIVVCSSKPFTETARGMFEAHGVSVKRDGRRERWRAGGLTVTTVEGLGRLSAEDTSGVILLDPRCHVHKARDFRTFSGRLHDRPQILVDYLAQTTAAGAPAGLFVWTLAAPKSLPTARMAEIYARAAWWFVDPNSIRFWEDK